MNELIVKEYLGNGIEFKVIEGNIYANATSMCKPFGKKFSHWLENKSTNEMIAEVSEAIGIPTGDLIITQVGVNSYIHEELVLELANWLDVKFRRWCQKQISTLLREGEVKIIKQDSYIIENPVERAKRWIEEYEEKLALENKIQENAPLVSLAKERLSFDDCVSITDISRTFNIKRGYLTSWAKKNGYIHKTITEVNQDGLEYFKIYDNGGFKNIGITKKGLKFIEMNLDEIKTK